MQQENHQFADVSELPALHLQAIDRLCLQSALKAAFKLHTNVTQQSQCFFKLR